MTAKKDGQWNDYWHDGCFGPWTPKTLPGLPGGQEPGTASSFPTPLPDLPSFLPAPPAVPVAPAVRRPEHVPGQPLRVSVVADTLRIGNVAVTFQRTLRIPDDGGEYPLPPGLGAFPLRRVEDYADRVPESWLEHGGVFLPMYQREAMWLSFHAAAWRPNALKVAVGKVNALSGKPWSERLSAGGRGEGEQDYMVVPDQPWLDGINAGSGLIKQFVAMPLGMGYTVEGQVTGKEEHGGLQLCVFEPKAGKFPDTRPVPVTRRYSRGAGGQSLGVYGRVSSSAFFMSSAPSAALASASPESFLGQEMGLSAGGRMKQSIYPDGHGVLTWDESNRARVFVHLVNSQMWTAITGEPLPQTPVTAASYAAHGLPWFDLYDEDRGDIPASDKLAQVKSVKEMDADKGFCLMQDDTSVPVPDSLVHKLTSQNSKAGGKDAVSDGSW